MKKLSKLWLVVAVVIIIAIVAWALSGGKKEEYRDQCIYHRW